jgi:ATP-binding cassette subfamily B protein
MRRQHGCAAQARAHALEQISFSVQAGQLVALVGSSGAGKTTLTYLIPRLYDPTHGRVLLDGHDLRDVTLMSLMVQIGMVTEETHLFHDTICTNLLYACRSPTANACGGRQSAVGSCPNRWAISAALY